MCDHKKRIVFASNRAQVVRSYTCATTTQDIFPCLAKPRSSCPQRACQPLLTLHRASDPNTRFVPRVALPWFPVPRLVHPLSRNSPCFHFGPTPGRSIASAVAVCGRVMTSFPKKSGAASHLPKLRSSKRSAMMSTQRVPARLRPYIQLSPQHGGRIYNAACCFNGSAAGSTLHSSSSSSGMYALVSSAMNVWCAFLRLE